jgi:site-specific DNA-methyltransferase (adenine-specific)
MAMAEYAWTSFHENAKVFEFAPQGNKEKRIHACQKPIELYAWLLNHYAKEGDKILDTHLGSGSSRIAAYKLGFDFVGCEIDKEYFEASQNRFEKECLGVYHTPEGVIKQLNMFDNVTEEKH